MQELIEVEVNGRCLPVLVARPVGAGPFPVVVLFAHGLGLSPEIQLAAQRVVAGGYAVVMIDRYNRVARLLSYDPSELLAEPKEARRYLSLLHGVTDAEVGDDLEAVVRHLKGEHWAKPPPWGTVGFGIGTRSMIQAMAGRGDLFVAGVGFHPSFCVTEFDDSPHRSVPQIKGHLFLGFGGSDAVASAEDNAALASALAPLGERGSHEIHPQARHGFAVPGAHYDRSAADSCFQAALKLFTRTLAW